MRCCRRNSPSDCRAGFTRKIKKDRCGNWSVDFYWCFASKIVVGVVAECRRGGWRVLPSGCRMMHCLGVGSILRPAAQPEYRKPVRNCLRPFSWFLCRSWHPERFSFPWWPSCRILKNNSESALAARIGGHQQHTVAVRERRAQVASKRSPVDIQQPAWSKFAIVDADLCETRKLLLEVRDNFSQAISVERDFLDARAATGNSKKLDRNRRQSQTVLSLRNAYQW